MAEPNRPLLRRLHDRIRGDRPDPFGEKGRPAVSPLRNDRTPTPSTATQTVDFIRNEAVPALKRAVAPTSGSSNSGGGQGTEDQAFRDAAARLEAGEGEPAGTGRRLGYDPMSESSADRTRREMRERDQRAGYSLPDTKSDMPTVRLRPRFESFFDTSSLDRNTIAQSTGMSARDRRFEESSQFERREGLRQGRERLALRREAFGDEPTAKEALRRSLEGGMGRFETIQRRRGLTEEQRQAEATAMRDAAAADTAALQGARGLREEARQADQTAAVTDRDSARRAATSGLRAQGEGGRSGGGSVLGPGGNYSPENVASQAATQMPSIMANLQRSNLGDFYETPEAAQGAYQNFLGDAARAQSRGALPEWVDDRTNEDMFTLSHALASAESRGIGGRLIGLIPGVRSTRRGTGDMNISSTDTLQSLLNVMRAEDGGEWTEANGSKFKLSELGGPSAQIYQRLKDQFREAGLLNETEE